MVPAAAFQTGTIVGHSLQNTLLLIGEKRCLKNTTFQTQSLMLSVSKNHISIILFFRAEILVSPPS